MKKKRRDFSPREQRMVDEFITRICKFLHISDKSGDLHQYAWEAFLSVYRDCPDSFCGTGFLGWKRAFSIIWDALVEERKERYRNLFQQISLNQPIGNETPVLRIELLQAPHGDFQNGVCLRDYLQRMNRDACRMAYGMIDGETIEEIQAYYRWSNAYTAYTYRILYNAIQEYLTI